MDRIESIYKRIRDTLDRRMPQLAHADLESFVTRYVDRADAFLSLCSEHGSPLYAFDRRVFLDRAAEFMTAFGDVLPNVSAFYAVKSNNHPSVVEAAVDAGLGLDVSSGDELELAVSKRCNRILFSGPGKTDEELSLAVEYRKQVTVLLDSFGELDRLDSIASSKNAAVDAGVRLSAAEHGLWRKFGIALGDLERFLAESRHCSRVRVIGLQFHTSWNLSSDRQIAFLTRLGAYLRELGESLRSQIEFIDIGGGFWPPQGEWLQEAGTSHGRIVAALSDDFWPSGLQHFKLHSSTIEEFAASLGSTIKTEIHPHLGCRIYTEPGRWLCNDAMHILLTVVDKKADDIVITDGGTNAVGWDRFETDYFPVINLSRPGLTEYRCAVYGSLCTPHDIWGYSYFGHGIERGDILLIPSQGAYTYSLRQTFIKPLPRVVVLDSAGQNQISESPERQKAATSKERRRDTDRNSGFEPR